MLANKHAGIVCKWEVNVSPMQFMYKYVHKCLHLDLCKRNFEYTASHEEGMRFILHLHSRKNNANLHTRIQTLVENKATVFVLAYKTS